MPNDLVWGQFYHTLHLAAQRLRAMMENTPTDSAILAESESVEAAVGQPKRVSRRVNGNTSPGIRQVEVTK